MNIKGFIICLVLILSGTAAAQEYWGAFSHLYFRREASAAAEAAGKQYLFNSDDALGSLYNPALPALNGSFNTSVSTSKRYGIFNEAYYNSEAVNVPVQGIGIFSFSRRYFNEGGKFYLVISADPLIVKEEEYHQTGTIYCK